MIIKKRHRILGIIISAVIVFAMVPVTAMAAYDYSLRIGDSGNIQETCSGDGWSWNKETRTLTLENFKYTSSEKSSGINYYNYLEEKTPLTIELIGENSIEMTGMLGSYRSGIEVGGTSLILQGEGSIDINGGDTVGDSHPSAGISCYGTKYAVTIKECTVNATAGNTSGSSSSYGIIADYVKIESGHVTAKSGTTSNSNAVSDGIWARDGFLITGGTLSSEGGKAGYVSSGIMAGNEGFEMTGGIVNAVGNNGGSEYSSYGINCNTITKINISGGSLTASGKYRAIWTNGQDKLIIDDSLSIFAGEDEDAAIKVDKYNNQKYARIEKSYDLWVGDTQITSTNANDVLNDGKVSYDDSTKTLTLNEYKYEGMGHNKTIDNMSIYAAIYSPEDLTIELNSENNTITMQIPEINNLSTMKSSDDPEKINAAIAIAGNLTITGNGSITVTGADVDNTDISSYGIWSGKNLTVDKVRVTAKAGEADVYSCGLYAGTGIEIAGEVTAYGVNSGIQSDEGDISISGEDTVVKASGSNDILDALAILAKNGEIKIESPLEITIPEGGNLSRDKDTVCAEGETEGAKEVEIKKLEEVRVFTITFDAKGGKVNPESAETNIYGMLDELPIPTRSGYTFESWFDEKGEEVTADTVFTENAIIYAQWIKNSISGGGGSGIVSFILTYETNGGEVIKAESHKAGDNVTLDKTPVKDGFTFTGWYADKECTQKIDSITMNSSKTVYAGWSNGAEVVDENAPLLVVTINETKYQLRGRNMEMDSAPFIDENDRTMLPVRVVANALGISDDDIAWDDATKTACFTRPDGKVVVCTVGSNIIKIGDEEVEIDTAPVIRNDRIYLPMRALFNAFNVSDDHIAWDGAARKVTVAKEALDDINALTEEAPVEEEPVEEVPAEETPAAETPAEETTAEEA